MNLQRLFLLVGVFGCLSFLPQVQAEDAAGDDGYAAATADDDYILYWSEYAILPKRCIV